VIGRSALDAVEQQMYGGRGDSVSLDKHKELKDRIVIEEADETVFWLELLADSGIVKPEKLRDLLAEGNQLLAIFSAARSTAKA
jgi:four helix bundle protein